MKKLTVLVGMAISLVPMIAQACPMCKDSIPNSDAPQAAGLSPGFNLSIYCMFIGLFLTMGFVAGVITKGIRSTDNHMIPPDDRSHS
ncbi:MAG TPA: hypothetical protein VKK61_08960 [Tepidisphaeraceae bacterium]|nr:hypothetical protein [Tepidisphaeraceae bacterium]